MLDLNSSIKKLEEDISIKKLEEDIAAIDAGLAKLNMVVGTGLKVGLA